MSFQQFKAGNSPESGEENRIYRRSLFWLTLFLMISCGATDIKTYQEDQIKAFNIEEMTDGILVLTVMPMLETLYFCAGAIV